MCDLGQHLEDVEVAALLLGALVHDFKHPGRSNAFLTKTGHSLAITYNDVSVLENYHLSEVGPRARRKGDGTGSVDAFLSVLPPEISGGSAELGLYATPVCTVFESGAENKTRQHEGLVVIVSASLFSSVGVFRLRV